MGLTYNSVGIKAIDSGLVIKKQSPKDFVITLAGNPNVGKSTVFNNLTGLNQHTGNWPGKTVTNARGYCCTEKHSYVMVDIPGTYSLMAHSAEEEVARNFICFGNSDAIIVVCDATCLERNLNLVLQTMEISQKVIVCVNLIDEAKRKNIKIDLKSLSNKLGVPVIATTARKKHSLDSLMASVDSIIDTPIMQNSFCVKYIQPIEDAISIIEPLVKDKVQGKINARWLSLRLLDYDKLLMEEVEKYLGKDIFSDSQFLKTVESAHALLLESNISKDILKDKIVSGLVITAEEICRDTVTFHKSTYNEADRNIDKILTSRWAGYPIMLGLLAVVFWLTITFSNYPSQMLSGIFLLGQNKLTELFQLLQAPPWLHGMLVLGIYRVLTWVIAVMLPPMAIFFPLFTLLEDFGYLPRVAFNLDKHFKKCCACGKQSLTMCIDYIIL